MNPFMYQFLISLLACYCLFTVILLVTIFFTCIDFGCENYVAEVIICFSVALVAGLFWPFMLGYAIYLAKDLDDERRKRDWEASKVYIELD